MSLLDSNLENKTHAFFSNLYDFYRIKVRIHEVAKGANCKWAFHMLYWGNLLPPLHQMACPRSIQNNCIKDLRQTQVFSTLKRITAQKFDVVPYQTCSFCSFIRRGVYQYNWNDNKCTYLINQLLTTTSRALQPVHAFWDWNYYNFSFCFPLTNEHMKKNNH